MIRVMAYRDLVCLISEAQISDSDSHMAYVIPHVCCCDIICHLECSFKASKSHVVLSCVKAAKTHIVPKFCVTDSTLHKSSIKSQSNLRLISVEMVASQLSYGFNA